MDLKEISKNATKGREDLNAVAQKRVEIQAEAQKAREVLQRIHDKEQPFVDYAAGLIDLQRATFKLSSSSQIMRVGPALDSPLVIVGNEGKDNHYFVAAKRNYTPIGDDGDGNPRGPAFTGYSFVASIGMQMTDREYEALPFDEREKLTLLGATLQGETMYGSVISSERFGGPAPSFTIGAQAELYEGKVSEVLADVAETIELVRRSLSDEDLNPRGRARIPESLL